MHLLWFCFAHYKGEIRLHSNCDTVYRTDCEQRVLLNFEDKSLLDANWIWEFIFNLRHFLSISVFVIKIIKTRFIFATFSGKLNYTANIRCTGGKFFRRFHPVYLRAPTTKGKDERREEKGENARRKHLARKSLNLHESRPVVMFQCPLAFRSRLNVV